jgi:hypothetical protein
MRCLRYASLLLLLTGCSSVYRNLRPAKGDPAVLAQFKPTIRVALYKAAIEVMGEHLSGLLLIKKMEDSSTRLVFSNEIGFKYFDFEFSANGGFRVLSIIRQMDRKPVIKTLRKDFQLIMMEGLETGAALIREDQGLIYYSFARAGGYSHYITNERGDELVRLERSSRRKPVMRAVMKNYVGGIPDTIGISHTNFKFTIGLKRIANNVSR